MNSTTLRATTSKQQLYSALPFLAASCSRLTWLPAAALVAQNLGLLVGPSQATQALLRCHTLRVRAAQQHLLKQHSAGGFTQPVGECTRRVGGFTQ